MRIGTKCAPVANAGGVHLARSLLAEFAANMAKLVGERAAPAAEATAAPAGTAALPQPAAALPAGRILWRALISWLRQVFLGKGQRGAG